MLAKSNGKCYICGMEETQSNWNGDGYQSLCIDHDHACCDRYGSCGKCVRGLLCSGCNSGLGAFKDDPARLRAAADYIERNKSNNTNR